MDEYTRQTKEWLDKRFELYSDGVYVPNQPIYGFSKLKERLEEYARTLTILATLDRLPFANFLDVGCADGYLLHLVTSLYKVPVVGSELSVRALTRAKELFTVSGIAADAHDLPFADNSFELVLCSEVLEHVTDPRKVVAELARVSSRWVILTTPAAWSLSEQERHCTHLDSGEPHRHLHLFTEANIRDLFPCPIVVRAARSKFVGRLFNLIAEDNEHRPEWRRDFFNFIVETSSLSPQSLAALRWSLLERYESRPRSALWFNQRTVKFLLGLDLWLSAVLPTMSYDFVIVASCRPGDNLDLGKATLGRRYLADYILNQVRRPFLYKDSSHENPPAHY